MLLLAFSLSFTACYETVNEETTKKAETIATQSVTKTTTTVTESTKANGGVQTTKTSETTSNNSQSTTNKNDSSNSTEKDMVWIPSSGTKYHSNSSCSNMNNPTKIKKTEAEQLGYGPCQRCY